MRSNNNNWSNTLIELHDAEMAHGGAMPAQLARTTNQTWTQSLRICSIARGMARCPFTRQANHPRYASLPIHLPNEYKTRKTKLWAIRSRIEHTLRTTQPVILRRLPISRSSPPLQSASHEASPSASPCDSCFAR